MTPTADPVDLGAGVPRTAPDFLDLARRRYQLGLDYDQIDRQAAEQDNVFANATDEGKEQWDQVPLRLRTTLNRPVMQWNRILTYVQQVVNDGRQNKPAIKISQGVNGTTATAEYFQDRIRQIEYDSNADIAYDTARDQQVTSGRGFIRVWADFVKGTFKQQLCIERIDNQFSVVFDPASIKYDRSDAEFCFVISQISKAEHARRYGPKSIVNRLDFTNMPGGQNPAPGWIAVGDNNDLIQIAEYWVKEYRKDTLVLITAKEYPVWKSDLTDDQYKAFKANGQITKERVDDKCSIKRYVINGAEILEEGDWIGSSIPIVPIWGREATVKGVRRTFSLIRMAKGPQKLVNLYVSNIAELIAQMPKVQWQAANGSIAENHMNDYRDSGFDPRAILFYNQYDPENGNPLNRPERPVSEPPIQALTIALQQAIDGIKAAMGIYDASLGARSNETSGVAIERRKKSAEIVNFHFSDNEARSRKRIGEILIEAISIIDQPGDQVTLRSEDGKTRIVPVGEKYADPKSGEEVVHDLSQGDYGVAISTGPTYDSQRQEIYERDLALIQANPELMFIFGDQMLASDDAPGSAERAERMKRAIEMRTPGLVQAPGQKQQIPPEVQQQIAGLTKEVADVHAFAQEQHRLATEKTGELEVKKYTVDEQEKTKRMIAAANLGSAEARVELEASVELTSEERDRAHELEIQEREHAHAAEIGAANRQDAALESGADRQMAVQQSDADRAFTAEQSDADRQAARESQDNQAKTQERLQVQAAKLAPKPKEKK